LATHPILQRGTTMKRQDPTSSATRVLPLPTWGTPVLCLAVAAIVLSAVSYTHLTLPTIYSV